MRHAAHDRLGRVLCGRMPGVTLGREVWAQETAGPVAARMGLPVRILPALNEIDFGAWAGQDFATP